VEGQCTFAVWIEERFELSVAALLKRKVGRKMVAEITGFLYVGRGVTFLLQNPRLWSLIVCPLLLSLIGALILLVVFLSTIFPAQAQALADANVPNVWAWILSFMLTLIEAALLGTIIFFIIFGQLQQFIFDKVYDMKKDSKAMESLAENERCCGGCVRGGCTYLILLKIFIMLLTLPLNILPILGQVLYALINGHFYAWSLHQDYLTIHGFRNFREQHEIVKSNTWYQSFGPVALFAEIIPLFGVLFFFSNAAGAALFAAEQEPALKFRERQTEQASNGTTLAQT